MTNRELDKPDRELLDAIEEIIAGDDRREHDADSLYRFSNLLARSSPVADGTFRQQLEEQLVSSLIEKQQEMWNMNVKYDNLGSLFSFFSARPARRAALSGLVLLALVFVGVLAISSPARAFAEELFNWVRGQVTQTKVIVIEDGVPVEQEVITTEENELQELEEAQSQVRFDIHLPGYVPAGYTDMRFDTFLAPRAVTVSFVRPRGLETATKSFELYQSAEPGIYAGGEPVGEVMINGKRAVWAESVATTYDDAGSPSPLISRSLTWAADGLYFTLRSYDLSQEEMIRIAESIE